MYPYSFTRTFTSTFARVEGGIMDLPNWYINVTFGFLFVVLVLNYATD